MERWCMSIKCMCHSCGHCTSNNVYFFHVSLSLFSALVRICCSSSGWVRTSLSRSPLSVWHYSTMPVRCIWLCRMRDECIECMKRFIFAQYDMQFLFVYELDQLMRFPWLHCWINVVHSSNFCGTMWNFFFFLSNVLWRAKQAYCQDIISHYTEIVNSNEMSVCNFCNDIQSASIFLFPCLLLSLFHGPLPWRWSWMWHATKICLILRNKLHFIRSDLPKPVIVRQYPW